MDGINSAIRSARADAARGATFEVAFAERGAASAIASAKAVDGAMDRLDGRDVTVDINADEKGIQSLSGSFSKLSGAIRGVATVAQASAIPFAIAGIGAGIPTILAVGASMGGLALNLGKAGAGFAAVGAVAGGGAAVGLKAYAAGISSTVSASREAYEATNEHRMEMLEQRRQQILSTEASTAFNKEIDRQVIGLTKLQAAVGSRVFPYFTTEMRSWGGVMRENQGEIAETAGGVARVAAGFSEWFRTAEDGRVFGRSLDFINTSALKGASILHNLGKTGVMAVQPLIPLADGLQTKMQLLANSAAEWTQSSKGQARLGEIYRSLYADATALGPVLMNLGRGVVNIFSAIDEAGLSDQASGGLARIASGFERVTAAGTKSRERVDGFLTNTRELMPSVGAAVMGFGGELFRVADAAMSARQQGSKLTVLQEVFKGLEESARPVGNLFISTFKGLGPEIGPLISNLARLGETFAGSSGPLVLYAKGMNQMMGAFNSLPGPVKSTAANLVALKLIVGGMGFGGAISGAAQLLINYRLLSGQTKILKAQQAGVAAGNAAVAASSRGAAAGVAAGGVAMAASGTKAAGAASKVGLLARIAPVAGVALTAMTGPIGLAVAGAVALGAGLVYAYRNSEKFREGVNAVGGVVGGLLVRAFENAKEVFGPVVGFFGKLGGGMLTNAAEKLGQLGAKVGEFFSWIGEKAQKSEGLQKIWTKLSDDRGAIDSAKEKLGPFFGWLSEKASESEGLGRIWRRLSDDKGAIESAKEKLGPFFTWLSEKASESEGLSRIWKKLSDDKGAVDSAKEKLGPLFSWISEKAQSPGFQKVWDKLRDDKGAVENVKGRLGDFFTWLGEKALDNEGLARIWKKLSDDKGALENTREKLGGFFAWLSEKAGENDGLGKIWTKLSDDKGAVENVREKLSGLKTWISEKFEEAPPGLQQIWTKLKDDKGAVEDVREKFGQVRASISSNSQAAAAATGEKFGQIYNSVSSKMAQSKNSTVRSTGELLQDVRSKWTQTEGSTREKFSSVANLVGNRMADSKNRASSRAGELYQDVRDEWTNTEGTTGEKFSAVRDLIGDRMREGKERGSERARELGENLGNSWENQRANANEKFSAIRDTIGEKLREGKERGSERIQELGANLKTSWENQLGAARGFGDKFADILGDKFGAAVNRARSWLSLLMFAAGNVLELVGADDLAGEADALGNQLKAPREMARGGIVAMASGGVAIGDGGATGNGSRIIAITNEAGPEAVVPLKRKTAEGTMALHAAADSRDMRLVPKMDASAARAAHQHGPPSASEKASVRYRAPRMMEEGGVTGSGWTDKLSNYPTSRAGYNWLPHVAQIANLVAERIGSDPSTYPGHQPVEAQAIDFMQANRAEQPGATIADFLWGNAPALGLDYEIFQQRIRGAGSSSWTMMEDRGSDTQNHFDHVHASFAGSPGSGEVSSNATYQGGGSGGGVFSGVMDALGNAWNSVTDFLAAKFKPPEMPSFGLGIIGEGMTMLGKTILDETTTFLTDKATELMQGADSGSGSSGPYKGGGQLEDWAKNGLILGNAFDPTPENVGKIMDRAMQESGGDPMAQNDWDSNAAAGTPSKGLMQVIEPTWNSNTTSEIGQFADNWSDPVKSVGVASRYMKSQYGYVVGATGQGYGAGGIIPGNPGEAVMLKAHAGERVLPREVVTSFDRLAHSVQLWSSRQTGTGAVRVPESSGEAAVERQTERMEAEMKRQTALMREQSKNVVRAVVKGVLTSTQSEAWWEGFDREFSAAMEEGDDYVAGSTIGAGR